MIALAIDGSTYRATIAVIRDGTVVATGEAAMRGRDADALMPAVAATIASAGLSARDLTGVICGAGPGSFTSLRMAAGIAKGFAIGLGLPLFPAPSLGLVVGAAPAGAGRFVATLDALRDEWYAAVFSRDAGGAVTPIGSTMLVARAELVDFAKAEDAVVVQSEPHASACVALMGAIKAAGPVDVERWEPAYGRLAEAQVKWEAAHGRPLRV